MSQAQGSHRAAYRGAEAPAGPAGPFLPRQSAGPAVYEYEPEWRDGAYGYADPGAPADPGAHEGAACQARAQGAQEGPYTGGPYADPWESPHTAPYTAPYASPHTVPYAGPYEPAAADPALPAPGGGRAAKRRAARRKRPAERPEGLLRLVPRALVVAFLAGGTSAFVATDKAVRLDVDGAPRTLHTFADDVDELLAEEGVPLGAHDVVAPGRGHGLATGDEVTIRYGRPLTLDLDGERRRVWTTARTVAGALRQLGVRAEGAHLSVAGSRPIARGGLDLAVRTERTVTFMADGREHTVATNAATVREALAAAGLTLHGQDSTSVAPDSFPREGQTISVMRITGGEEAREEPIPFHTVRLDDPALFKGTEAVEAAGLQGVRRVTYELRTVNGVKRKPKKLRTETVRAPRAQILRVGTRPKPTGADGLDWAGLAQCEAGGRPDAVDASGTYGGLYQFDTRTWHSLGGSGRPQDAPAAEQTSRAKKLYISRGASPWPVCGRKLQG
ncbi:ubiquitin-like domain-containing protein [Streptomyces sp. NPDC050610]|uniref:ubiquitin-like domain-containing protein n=1 Tax=Streptomyces sp. NPDC050610 TaxID=3157097 RepID=UPI00343DA6C4